jgi:hypothetical protein
MTSHPDDDADDEVAEVDSPRRRRRRGTWFVFVEWGACTACNHVLARHAVSFWGGQEVLRCEVVEHGRACQCVW